ncbi:LAFE_0H02861g1_1 [Lachancea fermentati]|uniref:LAFE_0H02861g1_1 n=1 Tax=Lachancea fermentati TaxID=4955 RepID=A0A1G4MJG3_LACFM|nr:LAFE_0H02861g1_1 [Lachancea fermentati]
MITDDQLNTLAITFGIVMFSLIVVYCAVSPKTKRQV